MFLKKNKATHYSIINILGLSIGLTGIILIVLLRNYEYSYDKWSPKLKRIFRISKLDNLSNNQNNDWSNLCDSRIGFYLRTDLTGIEDVTMIERNWWGKVIGVQVNENTFQEDKMLDCDSSFFKVFPYKFIKGNGNIALNKPNTIVISSELANKWFNSINVTGKIIKLKRWNDDLQHTYEITGVIELPKSPSALNFSAIFHSGQVDKLPSSPGSRNTVQIYVLAKSDYNLKVLALSANKLYVEELQKLIDLRKSLNLSVNNYEKGKEGIRFQQLQDIHIHPIGQKSLFVRVLPLAIIAILLLVIGIINFINLSIANAFSRIKEVGIRKVLGASKLQVMRSFLVDISYQCLLSLFFAMVLAVLILPYFNQYFDLSISFRENVNFFKLGFQIILILLLTILLSGIYPALFLAKYDPLKALNPDLHPGGKKILFQNSLIAMQFSLSIIFIISILIMKRQIQFIENSNLGFQPKGLLWIQGNSNDQLINELSLIPSVQYLGISSQVIGEADGMSADVNYNSKNLTMKFVTVGYETLKAMQTKLLDGRIFSKKYGLDSVNAIVVNKEAADLMGDNLIGKTIFLGDNKIKQQIVGIIDNYHYQGFEKEIEPTIYAVNASYGIANKNNLLIRVDKNDKNIIPKIKQIWKSFYPGFPLQYTYLDESFKNMEKGNKRLINIFSLYASISLLLSIIGLYSLTTRLVQMSKREISIRKVLGGSSFSIWSLINWKYIKIIAMANLIAYPIIFILSKAWLNNFAYRIHIPILPFLLITIASFLVASLIIGLQLFKISSLNPIKFLRAN